MENDPVTLVLAVDDKGEAQGQLYFDDGITHDWESKNEFILGNLSLQNGAINYSWVFKHQFKLWLTLTQARCQIGHVQRANMGGEGRSVRLQTGAGNSRNFVIRLNY